MGKVRQGQGSMAPPRGGHSCSWGHLDLGNGRLWGMVHRVPRLAVPRGPREPVTPWLIDTDLQFLEPGRISRQESTVMRNVIFI